MAGLSFKVSIWLEENAGRTTQDQRLPSGNLQEQWLLGVGGGTKVERDSGAKSWGRGPPPTGGVQVMREDFLRRSRT